jgi:tetratricopeptide (TPR) repeat protein
VAGALAIALSFLFPWLAELEARRAAQVWARDPAAASRALDRSRDLNPLSARADLLAGAIASRKDDVRRMAAAFEGAVERTPDDWYAHLELGIAYATLGRPAEALVQLRRAKELDPKEGAVGLVRSEVLAGRIVDRDQIDRLFVERVRSRVGP